MSKNNGLLSLISQLSRSNSTSLDVSKFVEPLLSTATGRAGAASTKASSSGLTSLSVGSTEKLHSIQFGKPSSNGSSASSPSGSAWKGLLSQTASGGLSSLLGGGLSSIAGLGGLISDITSLFGASKAAPPPLTLFSLPDSVQQSADVSSRGVSVDGREAASVTTSRGGSGIYTSNGLVNNGSQGIGSTSTNSAAIAQAVKSALLTSNTLGDVIAEL